MGGISKKEDYSTKRLSKDLWFFLKGQRLKFSFYLSLVFVSNLIPYPTLYLLGKIVDFFIVYDKSVSLKPFYIYVIIIGFLGAAQLYLRSIGKLNIADIGSRIKKNVRVMAFSRLMNLELSWHEKENTGSKMQKIQGGSNSIYSGFSFMANEGVQIVAGIIGSIFLFIFLEWKYALFGLVYALIYLYGEIYFNKKLKRVQVRLARMAEKVSGKIHESASNILAIKALGLKESVIKSTNANETAYYKVWLEYKQLGHRRLRSVKILTALGYAGFILLLGLDAANGVIQAATIFVMAGYFNRLSGSMDLVSQTLQMMIEIRIGIGRVMMLLDERIRQRESPDLNIIKDNWKSLEIDNLSFKYRDKLVLKNFSLTIARGEKIGIAGASGSGKSTISKLILGLYDPIQGEIKVDGKPLSSIKQSSINERISIVLQDSEMFNLPLKDNISISGENNELLLKKAIRVSHLQPVISKLSLGMNTLIGEKGYRLSGGERQRMGIARAVYTNPDMIIFDEATSHLDSKTESIIQENLEKELKDKTMVFIAHRLSTLKNVDRIIVLEGGRIIEEGSFNELIAKKGLFYQTYKLQSKH